jgi:hypothetical protein
MPAGAQPATVAPDDGSPVIDVEGFGRLSYQEILNHYNARKILKALSRGNPNEYERFDAWMKQRSQVQEANQKRLNDELLAYEANTKRLKEQKLRVDALRKTTEEIVNYFECVWYAGLAKANMKINLPERGEFIKRINDFWFADGDNLYRALWRNSYGDKVVQEYISYAEKEKQKHWGKYVQLLGDSETIAKDLWIADFAKLAASIRDIYNIWN